MREYHDAYREFSVPRLAREVLHGSLEDGINAAIECCDRWADDGRPALHWTGKDFAEKTVTFETLRDQSGRFANLLRNRGIGQGDVVGGLLPRIPELLVVALGSWRVGAIYQPLFTAFGPAAIAARVTSAGGSHAKLIVTDTPNRQKLDGLENCPPVLMVGPDFSAALAAQSPDFTPVKLRGDDPFVILFTSGTTGSPKAVRWPLRKLLNCAIYMRDAIGLRPEDRFWNVADPGWAYGMAFAVIGPLQLGHATTFFEGGFSVESALRVIASRHIVPAHDGGRGLEVGADRGPAPGRQQRGRTAQPGGGTLGRARVACAAPRSLRPDRNVDDGEQPPRPAPHHEARRRGFADARLLVGGA
jgi:acetyl-CoA synthetase